MKCYLDFYIPLTPCIFNLFSWCTFFPCCVRLSPERRHPMFSKHGIYLEKSVGRLIWIKNKPTKESWCAPLVVCSFDLGLQQKYFKTCRIYSIVVCTLGHFFDFYLLSPLVKITNSCCFFAGTFYEDRRLICDNDIIMTQCDFRIKVLCRKFCDEMICFSLRKRQRCLLLSLLGIVSLFIKYKSYSIKAKILNVCLNRPTLVLSWISVNVSGARGLKKWVSEHSLQAGFTRKIGLEYHELYRGWVI